MNTSSQGHSTTTGFALDTSGEVRGPRLIEQPDGSWRSHWTWDDLNPFTQGYVEALFANECPRCRGKGEFVTTWHAGNLHERLRDHGSGFGWFKCDLCRFDKLAPDALKRIIADCEYMKLRFVDRDPEKMGRLAFLKRQRGDFDLPGHGLPPLTPYLGDNGLIYLREGGDRG